MKALQQLHNWTWRALAVAGLLTLVAGPARGQRAPRHHRRPVPATPAPAPTPPPVDSLRQAVALPPATLDSLAAAPLVPAVDSARLLWLQTPPTFADLVGDRLSCLETAAPRTCNAAVLAYVRLFTERQRGYTQRVLEREPFYFPLFEQYLRQYGLPVELKYLAVVESALLPAARSKSGALGLWQFMGPTASDLRLRRDEWVDERIHPEKATEAACKHLRYLYRQFGDWEIVLAAYNWGEGSMRRVMRRTGKRNFWELYRYLPEETRNYVPTFTAVMYAMTYAREHQLHDPALRYQAFEPTDTLTLQGQAFDLGRLSRALGYDDSLALGRFNPEVRRGMLPAGYRPYVLRFPAAARPRLGTADRATLLAYCQPPGELPRPLASRPVRLAGVAPWGPAEATPADAASADATATAKPRRRLWYAVRRGQTVADLAEKFNVTPAQLRRWNELPRHAQKLRPGRELLVLLPRTAAAPSLEAAVPVVAAVAGAAARVAADSAALALTAANARIARQAQERAQRETARLRELAQAQRQQAARLTRQQQAARLALLAKAKEDAKARQALADAEAVTDEPADSTDRPALARPLAKTVSAVPRPKPVMAVETPAAAVVAVRPKSAGETKSALEPKPERPATYTARVGDNPTKIAREHGLSLAQLRGLNLGLGERVQLGQVLRVGGEPTTASAPRPTVSRLDTHVVQPGDTLFNISRRFGVSVERLRQLNHLTSDDVKLGQRLVVERG